MTVYVDSAMIRFGRMKMSHMIADDIDELHRMAEKLGLRRWFQSCPEMASFPHYDICKSKREEAIALGAVPVTRREMLEVENRLKRERPHEFDYKTMRADRGL